MKNWRKENREKPRSKGKRRKKGKDDIWRTEEKGSEEDFAEKPKNGKQMRKDDAERAFLGKKEEVHVDRKDEL